MTEAGRETRRGMEGNRSAHACVNADVDLEAGSNLGCMEASNHVVLVVDLAFERLDQLLKHPHLHAHTSVSNPDVHEHVYICVCMWVSACLQRKSCSTAGGVLNSQWLKGQ